MALASVGGRNRSHQFVLCSGSHPDARDREVLNLLAEIVSKCQVLASLTLLQSPLVSSE